MNGQLLTANGDAEGQQHENEFRDGGVTQTKSAIYGVVEGAVVLGGNKTGGDEIGSSLGEARAEDNFCEDEQGNCDEEARVDAVVAKESNDDFVPEGMVLDCRENEENAPCEGDREQGATCYVRRTSADEAEAALKDIERTTFHEEKFVALWSG
jgi:hypothetical protein